MRSEDEKKTVIKSLKMTKNECSIIEEKAKESGKSFSRYVVDSATSESGKTLNPTLTVKITNIVNMADEIAKQKNRRGISELRKEVEEIWSLLQ
ncbi:MAG: hypothetical protein II656_01340 [Ruminococcus sp.]|nr:hypothetical protein [Ruminococcus sp.]